jgi:hypothetical protein
MGDLVKHGVQRMRYGLVVSLGAVVASLLITLLWGPLYGTYGWRVVAIGLMLCGTLVVTGLMGYLVRPPRPYNRMYALYNIGGEGRAEDPPANDPSLLWQMLPIAACAIILLATLL